VRVTSAAEAGGSDAFIAGLKACSTPRALIIRTAEGGCATRVSSGIDGKTHRQILHSEDKCIDPSTLPYDLRRTASVRMTMFECLEKIPWRIHHGKGELLPQPLKPEVSDAFIAGLKACSTPRGLAVLHPFTETSQENAGRAGRTPCCGMLVSNILGPLDYVVACAPTSLEMTDVGSTEWTTGITACSTTSGLISRTAEGGCATRVSSGIDGKTNR
jgi:hypothetical protein